MSLQTRIRRLRAIAICASWAVWLLALGVALLTRLPQGYVLGIALLGFAPYLIALNLIEPWLIRRAAAKGLDTRLD
ncbi:MAG: hypothetical protein HOQ32_04345 [Lysobacter sp.]|nr:hypothetical protein [Lysobacter sp.]